MARKRLTQIFPWLIPIRTRQRLFCFYLGMTLDRARYTKCRSQELLPFSLFSSSCPMYNRETGFDMVYQENKVHNLKLAAAAIDGMLIRPGETFSFCLATRYADREIPYQDGLAVINGRLTTAPGGGLCQLTNLLFWVFLHSPLTIVERHGHGVKDFPEPPSDAPMGVDATISAGWLDLKVKNETESTFQIHITFDSQLITGQLLTDRDLGISYQVVNGDAAYYRKNSTVWEEVDVIQNCIQRETGRILSTQTLYRNKCEIGYQLPAGTPMTERK